MSTEPAPTQPVDFSFSPDGEFDELFLRDCSVHIERMNETGFWIGIDFAGGRVTVNTGVYRGEWFFNVEEDTVGGQSAQVTRPRRGVKIPSPFAQIKRMDAIIERYQEEIALLKDALRLAKAAQE